MNKKITLLLTLFSMGAFVSAHASEEEPFPLFGNIFDSETAAGDQSQGCCISSDGNVYWHLLGGSTHSARDITYAGQLLFQGADMTESSNTQNNNLCVMKTDRQGKLLWKMYSSTGDYANNQGSVAPTTDGGVIFSAKVRSSDDGGNGEFLWNDLALIDGKGITHSFEFKHDATDTKRFYQVIVGRLSSTGELLWLKSFQTDRYGVSDTNKTTFIPDAISCPALAVDKSNNVYFGGNYRTTLSIATSAGDVTLIPHNANNITSDAQINVGDMFIVKLNGTDGAYLNSQVTKLIEGSVSSETLNLLTFEGDTLYAQALMYGNGAQLNFNDTSKSFTLAGTFSPVLMSFDTSLQPNWIQSIKGEDYSGKYGFQNCGISVCNGTLWFSGMFDGIISVASDKEVASTAATPSVREGFLIKFNASTGEWIKGVSSRDSYPTTLGTGYNAICGYLQPFQNPDDMGKVYVYGYAMNNSLGVFLRTYDAETLISNPDSQWILAGGNMPTCQAAAYDPTDGQFFMTARSNRAFTLYGGETVANPSNTWAILMAGFQMPEAFIQLSKVDSCIDEDLFKVTPLPGRICFQYDGMESKSVNIYDILGRCVAVVKVNPGVSSIELPSGLYLVSGHKIRI